MLHVVQALQFEDVFDRVTFLKNDTPREVVIETMRSRIGNNPLNRLASGAFAAVYEFTPRRVFKMGDANDNSGYLTFLRSIDGVKNVHFPQIFSKELFVYEKRNLAHFLIEMELLLPHDEVTCGSGKLPEQYGNMLYMDWAAALERHLCWNTPVPEKVDVPFEMPATYYEAAKIIRQGKSSRASVTSWDLNWSNIMFRPETYDVVITDPMT
jgi:hypothetical protein